MKIFARDEVSGDRNHFDIGGRDVCGKIHCPAQQCDSRQIAVALGQRIRMGHVHQTDIRGFEQALNDGGIRRGDEQRGIDLSGDQRVCCSHAAQGQQLQ